MITVDAAFVAADTIPYADIHVTGSETSATDPLLVVG